MAAGGQEAAGSTVGSERSRTQSALQTEPLLHRGSASSAAHTRKNTAGTHRSFRNLYPKQLQKRNKSQQYSPGYRNLGYVR